jgi:hypothetical protein
MTSTRGAGMTPRSMITAGCAAAMLIPQPNASTVAQADRTKSRVVIFMMTSPEGWKEIGVHLQQRC